MKDLLHSKGQNLQRKAHTWRENIYKSRFAPGTCSHICGSSNVIIRKHTTLLQNALCDLKRHFSREDKNKSQEPLCGAGFLGTLGLQDGIARVIEKLVEVKLGELPSWILMWGLAPPPAALQEPFSEGMTGITKTSMFRKAACQGLTWCWWSKWFSASKFLTRSSNRCSNSSTPEEGSLWRVLHV